jgi:hypothetical protein
MLGGPSSENELKGCEHLIEISVVTFISQEGNITADSIHASNMMLEYEL